MSTTTAATVSNRASVSRQPNFFAHDVHLRHETQVLGCHRGPVADTTGRQLTPDAANEPPTNDLETLQARDQLLSGLRKRVELMQRYSKLADVSKTYRSGAVPGVPLERTNRSTHRIHNVRKRLGPEAIAQLVSDYQAGASTLALMQQYSIGKGTVLGILDDHGVTRRHQPLTEDQVQQAIELYQQGWSLARVGRRLGRDDTLIHLTLKRAVVARRDTHGRSR